MSSVGPGPERDVGRVGDPAATARPPRPGDGLAVAAVVPLAAAVLAASGLLPWGARAVVAAAVIVLGWRACGLGGAGHDGRVVPGAAIDPGAGLVRGAGAVALAVGAVLLAGALAVGIDGGTLGTAPQQYPDADSSYVEVETFALVGVPAVALGAVLAMFGGVVARRGVGGPVGVVALGAGGAVVVNAVVGRGGVGLGVELGQILSLVVAAVAAGVVARVAFAPAPSTFEGDVAGGAPVLAPAAGASRGASRPFSRALGVGAGVLVALVVGEATGLVQLLVSDRIGAWDTGYEGVVRGVLAVLATATAGTLLAVAVRWRDPVVGLVPLGVVLQSSAVTGVPSGIGVLVVPTGLLVVLALAARGRGPLAGRLGGVHARLLIGGAVLAGLAGLGSLLSRGAGLYGFDDVPLDGRQLALAVACSVAVLVGVVLARRSPAGGDDRGTAVAVLTLLGLYALHPAWTGVLAVVGPFGKAWPQVIALVVELSLAGLVVAHHRRAPLVLGGGALVLADVAGHIASVVRRQAVETTPRPTVDALVELAPSATVLLVVAALAVLGPERLRRAAQAAAVGAGFATALAADSTAYTLVVGRTDDEGRPVAAALAGGQVVVALALTLVVLAGAGLLAASAARRGSGPVAAVAGLLALTGGLLATSVGAGMHRISRDDEGPRLADGALGFRAARSMLDQAGGGWPAGLAALAVLLAALAWWRRRAAGGLASSG